ncbi:GGDEF and EAL domain-containing protein [Fulvimarina sp. MAC8]|uniref:putative bifunctional diguanylate cyclase/phosphodiesterase n=1 Tax=Fulvimarina sp. MAC8 TaxID=3162874 RepID=UPI0032EFB8E8
MNDSALDDKLQAELGLPWYARRDTALNRLHYERRESDRAFVTRFSMWAAIVIFVSFSAIDYFLIPDVFWLTTIFRVSAGAIAFLLTEYMHRRKASSDVIDEISGLIIIGCYFAWLYPAAQSNDLTTLSYYFVYGILFMMVSNLFFDFPTHIAVRTSFTVLAGGLMSVFWLPETTHNYIISTIVFYASCFAVTSYVNWKLERERYHVFLNAYQAELNQSEVEQRGRELLALSRTDPLTGLSNRRAIDEKLERYWEDWLQFGQSFAVLLIDVDYFKPYNDFYGHQEGDQCLVELAATFSEIAAARQCVVGRFGGEEFIFLFKSDEPQSVSYLAERIRSSVESIGLPHERRNDGRKSVTISIGAAISHSSNGTHLENLIQESDRALYRAKDRGRNRIELYDPVNPIGGTGKEDIGALLDKAIDSGLASMIYQPIIDIETNETIAVEALMRLERSNGRVVRPSVFIPVAESTGQINSLGRWALQCACRDVLAKNLAEVVSVNVSVMQLKTSGFSLYTAALLGRLNIDPKRLALEITESQTLDAHPEALNCINELKRLGVKIWLDDFGSGYSGLAWLQKVDFDLIKIDGSLMHDRMTARDKSMLSDLIRLIRHRGHAIVIEGIETPQQLNLMRKYDVRYAQGFHLSWPISLSQLEAAKEKELAAS